MKKIYVPFIFYSAVFLMMSCTSKDFLDQTVTSDLTEEAVFADSARTVAFLNNIYTDAGFSTEPLRFTNGGLDAACDEGEPQKASDITTSVQFATGSVNPAIITDDAWKTCYKQIRNVNQLLKHLPNAPIVSYVKPVIRAEARFLRAWYYSILLEHYGGIPLIGDTIYAVNDHINARRNTYKECVDYIVSECDAAASSLTVTRVRDEYGRVSGGACKSLKARVLLYAASPLYNEGNIEASNALTGYTGSDNTPEQRLQRWKDAADAARDVINLHVYSLNEDNVTAPGYGFYKVFLTRVNTEYIFAKMQNGNADLEKDWQPPSRNGAKGAFPYQELVDAFGMANGKSIGDESSGYDHQNPYANRDPRMNYTIIHDQTAIMQKTGVLEPVNIYLGPDGRGVSVDAVHEGTPTGYYINKMLDVNIAANNIHGTSRSRPLMRYAEVLLNFAEAQNEYGGPTQEVYDAVEAIRRRAGLNPYQLASGLSKEEMREIIHNERRLELAFEGHRFWDVRRWKVADETENKTMTGMEVRRNGSAVSYNVFTVRKHNFKTAMYFWPIPQGEAGKSPELIQNPGW